MTQQVEPASATASVLAVGDNNATLHLMQYQKQERLLPRFLALL